MTSLWHPPVGLDFSDEELDQLANPVAEALAIQKYIIFGITRPCSEYSMIEDFEFVADEPAEDDEWNADDFEGDGEFYGEDGA